MRMYDNKSYSEDINCISDHWIKLFNHLDITPILIPNNLGDPVHFFVINKCQGLILTNGEDSQLQYDEGEVKGTKRDITEFQLIDYCIKKSAPVFGFCRGHQFINLFFGGENTTLKGHVGKDHELKIVDATYEKRILSTSIKTNSFHNIGVLLSNLGHGLIPWALDNNIVEGMYHEKYPIQSIQWHPERYKNYKLQDLLLIKEHFKL